MNSRRFHQGSISLRYNSSSNVNSGSMIGKIRSSKKVESVSHAGDSSMGVGDPSCRMFGPDGHEAMIKVTTGSEEG